MTTKNNELRQEVFGTLKQGEMPIETYYDKIKSICEKFKYSSEETKSMFLNGLNFDNKVLAQKIGIELPPEKMVQEIVNFIGQGNMSIETYYNRIIRNSKEHNLSSEDTKRMFINGLSYENLKVLGMVSRIRILPLEYLVQNLESETEN